MYVCIRVENSDDTTTCVLLVRVSGCELQMWNIHNIRQSVYSIERLERPINTVHLAADIAVCSTRNDIGQTKARFPLPELTARVDG